jgi:hypothetical protein
MDTQREKRKTASHEIRERERCNDRITKGQQYHHITNDTMVSRVLTITRGKVCG